MPLRIRHALVITLVGAGFASFASFSQAQMGHHGSHSSHDDMPAAKAAAATPEVAWEEGVVKKIDKAAGKVSVAHGDLKNGMPAMTMAYKVKDAVALDKLRVDQKIRFATDPADGRTLARMEPVNQAQP